MARDAVLGIKGHLEKLNHVSPGSPLLMALEKHLGTLADLGYEQMQAEMARFDPYGDKGRPSLTQQRR